MSHRDHVYRREDKAERRMALRRKIYRMDEENQQLQKKQDGLEISQPDDKHEQEADSIARKVVSNEHADLTASAITSSAPATQRKEEDTTLMAKGEGGVLHGTGKLQSTLDSSKGAGQSLDDKTKTEMESKMNADLGDVRIHTDSKAHEMSEGINAKAFTHGQDIYFKNGNYDPNSNEGKELLAHELVHTQQQKGGVERKVMRQEDPATKKNEGFIKVTSIYNVTPLYKTKLWHTTDDSKNSQWVVEVTKANALTVTWESNNWYFVKCIELSADGYIRKGKTTSLIEVKNYKSIDALLNKGEPGWHSLLWHLALNGQLRHEVGSTLHREMYAIPGLAQFLRKTSMEGGLEASAAFEVLAWDVNHSAGFYSSPINKGLSYVDTNELIAKAESNLVIIKDQVNGLPTFTIDPERPQKLNQFIMDVDAVLVQLKASPSKEDVVALIFRINAFESTLTWVRNKLLLIDIKLKDSSVNNQNTIKFALSQYKLQLELFLFSFFKLNPKAKGLKITGVADSTYLRVYERAVEDAPAAEAEGDVAGAIAKIGQVIQMANGAEDAVGSGMLQSIESRLKKIQQQLQLRPKNDELAALQVEFRCLMAEYSAASFIAYAGYMDHFLEESVQVLDKRDKNENGKSYRQLALDYRNMVWNYYLTYQSATVDATPDKKMSAAIGLEKQVADARDSGEYIEVQNWFSELASEEAATRMFIDFMKELAITMASIYVGGIFGRIASVFIIGVATETGGTIVATNLLRTAIVTGADTAGFTLTQRWLTQLDTGKENPTSFGEDYMHNLLIFGALKVTGGAYSKFISPSVSNKLVDAIGGFAVELATLTAVESSLIAWSNMALPEGQKQEVFSWESLGKSAMFILGLRIGMVGLRALPPPGLANLEKGAISKLDEKAKLALAKYENAQKILKKEQEGFSAFLNEAKIQGPETPEQLAEMRTRADKLLELHLDALKQGLGNNLFSEKKEEKKDKAGKVQQVISEADVVRSTIDEITRRREELKLEKQLDKFNLRASESDDVFYFDGESKAGELGKRITRDGKNGKWERMNNSNIYKFTPTEGLPSYFISVTPSNKKVDVKKVASERFGNKERNGWKYVQDSFRSQMDFRAKYTKYDASTLEDAANNSNDPSEQTNKQNAANKKRQLSTDLNNLFIDLAIADGTRKGESKLMQNPKMQALMLELLESGWNPDAVGGNDIFSREDIQKKIQITYYDVKLDEIIKFLDGNGEKLQPGTNTEFLVQSLNFNQLTNLLNVLKDATAQEKTSNKQGTSISEKLKSLSESGRDLSDVQSITFSPDRIDVNGGKQVIIPGAPLLDNVISIALADNAPLARNVNNALSVAPTEEARKNLSKLLDKSVEKGNTNDLATDIAFLVQAMAPADAPLMSRALSEVSDPSIIKKFTLVHSLLAPSSKGPVPAAEVIRLVYQEDINTYVSKSHETWKAYSSDPKKEESLRDLLSKDKKHNAQSVVMDIAMQETYGRKLAVTAEGANFPGAAMFAGQSFYFHPDLNMRVRQLIKLGKGTREQFEELHKKYPQGIPFSPDGVADVTGIAIRHDKGQITGALGTGEIIETDLVLAGGYHEPKEVKDDFQGNKKQEEEKKARAKDEKTATALTRMQWKNNGWGKFEKPQGAVWHYDPSSYKMILVDGSIYQMLGYVPGVRYEYNARAREREAAQQHVKDSGLVAKINNKNIKRLTPEDQAVLADLDNVSLNKLNKLNAEDLRIMVNSIRKHGQSAIDALRTQPLTGGAADFAKRLDKKASNITGANRKIYDSIVANEQYPNWSIVDTKKGNEVETEIIYTSPGGEVYKGYVKRTMEISGGETTFILDMAFFDKDLPSWIKNTEPLDPNKGTPLITYITLRQMKLLGIGYGGISKVKMSMIQNIETIAHLHYMMKTLNVTDPSQLIKFTHSINYAETFITQAGEKISSISIENGYKEPIKFLTDHFENEEYRSVLDNEKERYANSHGGKFPTGADLIAIENKAADAKKSKANEFTQTLKKYGFDRNEEMFMSFDIIVNLEK